MERRRRAGTRTVNLHTIDIILIALYFVVVVYIGIHFAKRHAGTADYFLAGRRLGWIVIGMSLFASNISSTTLVGLSGAAYHTGISISNYEWMAAVVLVFFAIYFIPYYIGARIYTMPEFLERRFRPACRFYFSGLTIVGNIFIDTAGTLFAGSLVVHHFFPAIELWQAALVLGVATGTYTAVGGLAAVVYTDLIQAIILLIGASILTWLALDAAGSWQQVMQVTPPEMMSVIRPLDDPTMPWLGLVVGVPVLGFYFWCTNQFIVQRVLGARDINHARWGALFGGFLKLLVLFIMVFPGIIARPLFPDLPRPDLVFPTLISELLPVGIKGLVLAGTIAAIMSSIDSTLNSASTLVTMDFVKRLRPDASDERLALIGRAATIVFMLVSILWVPVVAKATTLFEYLQSSLAYLFPPVVAVFLIGLFWKRASGSGALAALVVGHAIALSVFVLQKTAGWFDIHFLILAGLFLAVSGLVMVVVSLTTAPPDTEQVKGFTWSKETLARYTAELGKPRWYQDYRWQSAALIALTAWMVWAYR